MKDENIVYLGPEMKGKSLQELAEHLKGRELFPESNRRMKELIANVKWPKELLTKKK